MTSSDIALPLVAALWATASLMHTMSKELNEKRDRIVFGHEGGARISKKYRLTLLRHDWIPSVGIVVIISLAFALMIGILPCVIEKESNWVVNTIAWVAAGFWGLVAVGWIIFGIVEYRLMRKYIDSNETALVAGEKVLEEN